MLHRKLIDRCLIPFVLLMTLLFTIGGCRHGSSITGKVTYKGRPVIYGSIICVGADKTARSGVIGPDGSYTVENVPAGTVNIAVISRDPSKGRSVLRGEKPSKPGKSKAASSAAADKQWFPLPSKFEDAKKSGLVCDVNSGRVAYDIDLK